MFVFLKLLSPAYRKRRESVLRLRRIRPSRRRFVRLGLASYSYRFTTSVVPGAEFRIRVNDPFEGWLDQWQSGNAVQLYCSAKEY